ncbi:hypothetical protein [Amycolatopsis suaedae]|uniref:Uncharacterized protein n=1 Tax=Amycolatopsis suaedae TaxID=2510978 RepID=A0A4Q7J3G2_9PSEU|nr:hypothetical protein [Amycolatopsis suaedae]RZQ60863.1 hypothetical protein EWH70_27580 [Amycolatopsis suaedae]
MGIRILAKLRTRKLVVTLRMGRGIYEFAVDRAGRIYTTGRRGRRVRRPARRDVTLIVQTLVRLGRPDLARRVWRRYP